MISPGREPRVDGHQEKNISRGTAADPFSIRPLRTGLSPLGGFSFFSTRVPGTHAPGYEYVAALRLSFNRVTAVPNVRNTAAPRLDTPNHAH